MKKKKKKKNTSFIWLEVEGGGCVATSELIFTAYSQPLQLVETIVVNQSYVFRFISL